MVLQKCKNLIDIATVFPLDDAVAEKAIDLKRMKNIRLADAVIAATALCYNLQLVTRNSDDFKMIEGLHVLNPLE